MSYKEIYKQAREALLYFRSLNVPIEEIMEKTASLVEEKKITQNKEKPVDYCHIISKSLDSILEEHIGHIKILENGDLDYHRSVITSLTLFYFLGESPRCENKDFENIYEFFAELRDVSREEGEHK